jgi:hypothetical protein
MRHNALSRILVVAGLLALSGCSKPAAGPDSPAASGSTATSSEGNPASAPAPLSSSQANPASDPARAPEPSAVVHPGTTFSVTVDQSISSKTSNSGDHFDASLAAPVRVGGTVVIPSGARVVGVVTDAKSAGKFNGHAELTVTLDSVRVNGARYRIRTTSVTQVGKGRGKRTGIGAGGGAVVGGIIGAIAGGGKGAAIGAGAGAGAGAAGAGFTGERDVEISPETRLSFKLKDPLEIGGK